MKITMECDNCQKSFIGRELEHFRTEQGLIFVCKPCKEKLEKLRTVSSQIFASPKDLPYRGLPYKGLLQNMQKKPPKDNIPSLKGLKALTEENA